MIMANGVWITTAACLVSIWFGPSNGFNPDGQHTGFGPSNGFNHNPIYPDNGPKSRPNFGLNADYKPQLSIDDRYPSADDNVTLTCRLCCAKKPRKITWIINGNQVFSTRKDNDGKCLMEPAEGFDQRRSDYYGYLSKKQTRVLCTVDTTTTTLTLFYWKSGDRWACREYPFDSNFEQIQSLISLRSVKISELTDKREFTSGRGPYGNDNEVETIVSCKTSPCRPQADITWVVVYSDGTRESHAGVEKRVISTSSNLQITTSMLRLPAETDEGPVVFCKASNIGSEVQSDELNLTSKRAPIVKISTLPLSGNGEKGSTVTLYCRTTGQPRPKVKWFREESNSEDKLISEKPVLEIPNFSASDTGRYRCMAINGNGLNASDVTNLSFREREQRPPGPNRQPPSWTARRTPAPTSPLSSLSSSSSLLSPSSAPESSSINGGIIGGIAVGAVLLVAILILIVVILVIVLRKRLGKQAITGRDNREFTISSLDAEGENIYAGVSGSALAKTVDEPPAYVDLIPPSYSELKVMRSVDAQPRPGMDGPTDPKSRALPSPPYDADAGYEVINDVDYALQSTNQSEAGPSYQPITPYDNDGYEVPETPTTSSTTAATGDEKTPDWNLS